MIRYWQGSTEITTDFGQRWCGLGLTGGQVIVVLNGSPGRCRPGAQGPPAHAAPRPRLRPANKGHDTRAIQGWLGHRSITSTAVYTALAPNRFKDFWRD
jgi:hypothetical protein